MSDTSRRGETGADLQRTVEDAADRPWIDRLGRFGYGAKGVLHLVVAAIAGSVGFLSGEEASQTGAISTLSEQSFGTALLVVLAVGLAAYAVLRLLHVVINPSGEDGAKGILYRISYLSRAVVYGALTSFTIKELFGDAAAEGDSEQQLTATLLDLPSGVVLVALIALVAIAVGVLQGKEAIDASFMGHLPDVSGQRQRWTRMLGRIGYAARAVLFGMVGVLFARAALQSDSSQAGGLDEALQALASTPVGTTLLTAVAIGLACYGLFCLAVARWGEATEAG